MKLKTKMIASIMSICLVCAVFAIGVFALKTANLKIGGDVSFSATGVEADIKNVTLTGATNNDQVLATGSINTSMTQADIDTKFQNWQSLKLFFDENATDIELKFQIANTSTNADNYIEIDYDYSFTTENPNVDVFPGDENEEGEWENNNYILAPKGATPAAGDYETFTLKFKVLNKELNVPEGTKVNLNIELKHIEPVLATGTWSFDTTVPVTGEALPDGEAWITGFTEPNNWDGIMKIPAIITDGINKYIISGTFSSGGIMESPSGTGICPEATKEVVLPNSIRETNGTLTDDGNALITTIDLPVSLTDIGHSTFCTGGGGSGPLLTTINIPNSVRRIGPDAFAGLAKIISINIPSSVIGIDASAFRESSLVEIVNNSQVSITHTGYSLKADVNIITPQNLKSSQIFYVDDYIFRKYLGENYLVSYIGNSINLVLPTISGGYKIREYAFAYADFDSVLIPECVIGMETNAFLQPISLKIVKINNQEVVNSLWTSGLQDYASSVYIKVGLDVSLQTDLTSNYSTTEITGDIDDDGYILYQKKTTA